jgi:hypothetical protein
LNSTFEETRKPKAGISRDDLIKQLKENLVREYKGIISRLVYSQILRGAESSNFAENQ